MTPIVDEGTSISKTRTWIAVNPSRNRLAFIALLVVTILMISLVVLPLIYYGNTRPVWIWGWSDTGFTYWKGWLDIPPRTDFMQLSFDGTYFVTSAYDFYNAVLAVIGWGFTNLIFYAFIVLALIRKHRKYQVIILRVTAGWTWLWGIGIAIGSGWAARIWIVFGYPSLNADIALIAAVILSVICRMIKPTAKECDALRTRLTWIKSETPKFFARGELDSLLHENVKVIDVAREVGARDIRYDGKTYAYFLPMLWVLYRAFSKQDHVTLTSLSKELQMIPSDFSRLILDLARKYNMTINGDVLVVPANLAMDAVLKTAEYLLINWQVEVNQRLAVLI